MKALDRIRNLISINNYVVNDEINLNLNPRQKAMTKSYSKIVSKYGLFEQGSGANGGHYILAGDNPFASKGMKCYNCIFYINGDEETPRAWKSDLPQGGCSIMVSEGELVNYIHPEGLCKLWIIPEEYITETPVSKSSNTFGFMGAY